MRNYRVKMRKVPDGRKLLTGPEDEEQKKVIQWARLQENVHPELKLLFHPANGGKRNRIEAAKFKEMGVRAGVPDLVLPVKNQIHNALFLELKVGMNNITEKQEEYMLAAAAQGSKCVVCWCADDAIACIKDYLEI